MSSKLTQLLIQIDQSILLYGCMSVLKKYVINLSPENVISMLNDFGGETKLRMLETLFAVCCSKVRRCAERVHTEQVFQALHRTLEGQGDFIVVQGQKFHLWMAAK